MSRYAGVYAVIFAFIAFIAVLAGWGLVEPALRGFGL